MVEKIPYRLNYPTTARFLIEEGVASTPRQITKTFYSTNGLDIEYSLHNLTPTNFAKYSDQLLLLAFQEASRYNKYKYKFARFEVKLGRLLKGRDIPEVASFQASMHPDPDVMVYGPGYEVPQRHFLYNKVEDILDIAKRYSGKVNKQNPYKVIKLIISIRQPMEYEPAQPEIEIRTTPRES